MWLSTRWRSRFKRHQARSVVSIILPEVYFVCLHSPLVVLVGPGAEPGLFYGCSVCSSGRTGTSEALSGRRGTGRCRRVDLTRC